jgi:hypothetical protein
MVAYEQQQAEDAADSSNSGDSSSRLLNPHTHNLAYQSIAWELRSFLRLFGKCAIVALRWFKRELELMLPLLEPIDTDKSARTHTCHPVAAQTAAYRACMRSIVQQQLLLLESCKARAL